MSDPFERGRQTGLTWDVSWEPGGPWRCRCPECQAETEEYLRLWWLGFKKGREDAA